MLKINKGTKIIALKKANQFVTLNFAGGEIFAQSDQAVRLERAVELELELDEQGAFSISVSALSV